MGKQIDNIKVNCNLLLNKDEVALKLNELLSRALELKKRNVGTNDEYTFLQKDHQKWKDFCEEYLTRAFTDHSIAEKFKNSSLCMAFTINPSMYDLIERLFADIDKESNYLESLIERLELIPCVGTVSTNATKELNQNVFLVHGHNHSIKQEVARFIEKLKLSPIILDEQVNEGKTIIEKFEHHASLSSTAVVILTADDIFFDDSGQKFVRARQNVILELGYFLSSLKRYGVIALYEEGVEIPSDFAGVLYISLKEEWQIKVAKEFKRIGLQIDLNNLA